jgi:pimeloyl-ACP methyl ester carboxylesterase
LVRDHAEVFAALPAAIHEGVVRAYIQGASHRGLSEDDLEMLVAPWRGEVGQAAFYRQIAEGDQRFTDQIEPRYRELNVPVLVTWGAKDAWVPAEHATRLVEMIPGAEAVLIDNAGHLVQLDAPVELATTLHGWLQRQEREVE